MTREERMKALGKTGAVFFAVAALGITYATSARADIICGSIEDPDICNASFGGVGTAHPYKCKWKKPRCVKVPRIEPYYARMKRLQAERKAARKRDRE
jgi:hypothetical protein